MDQQGKLNRHDEQFGSSHAAGGQVPVRRTTEGDRRNGKNESRGYVSPLGGQTFHGGTGDQSPQTENRQQPTRGYASSGRQKGYAG